MKKIKDFIGVAAGLLLAIGPYTFLHVCRNMSAGSEMSGMSMGGMEMAGEPSCHGIPAASLVTGLLLIIVSLVSIASFKKAEQGKTEKLSVVIDILRVAVGIVAIGIPTFLIGVCSSAHMHCHMVTRPALIIIGAVVGLTGVAGLIYQLFKSRDESVVLNEQPQ
jgi:hypothetical protein